MSLDKHVSTVCLAGFFHRVWQFVNCQSAATLVHVFVTSCIDYCNAIFVVVPKCLTNFNGCWTRVLMLSAVLRSLTMAWQISCMHAAVAGHSWPCPVQDRDHGLPTHSWPGSAVLGGLLYTRYRLPQCSDSINRKAKFTKIIVHMVLSYYVYVTSISCSQNSIKFLGYPSTPTDFYLW